MSDPFTLVYNALWVMAERNTELTSLIPLKNRIKFDASNPPKMQIAESDTPELALTASGASFGVQNNNSNYTLDRRYDWIVTSGDYRINPKFNAISFELMRAMVDYESTLCALTWEDCNFVNRCNLTDADEGIEYNRSKQNRNLFGWSGVITVEIRFVLPYSKLRIT